MTIRHPLVLLSRGTSIPRFPLIRIIRIKQNIMFIIALFLIINLVAFVMYGYDKRKAKRHEWRVSEAALLLVALAGGPYGAWLGMKVFRHKTKHWKFRILIPLTTLLWTAGIMYLIWYCISTYE